MPKPGDHQPGARRHEPACRITITITESRLEATTAASGIALFQDFDGSPLEIAAHPESIVAPGHLPSLLPRLAQLLERAFEVVSGHGLASIDELLFGLGFAGTGACGEVQRLRETLCGRTQIIGVDRLDYTKGLPQRFQSIQTARHMPLTERQQRQQSLMRGLLSADVAHWRECFLRDLDQQKLLPQLSAGSSRKVESVPWTKAA